MITKFDAEDFGSFKNFKWDNSLRDAGGNVVKFNKLNIIYGKNYSGKTTLSRAIRILENGVIPKNYLSPRFTITTDKITYTESNASIQQDDVRVYNKDFVDENLSFLRNESGDITPFAILGSDNTSLMAKIKESENKLGSLEAKCGLINEHHIKQLASEEKEKEAKSQKESIENQLSHKATKGKESIKHNALLNQPNYNITKIIADIKSINSQKFTGLTDEEKTGLTNLLRETPLQDIALLNKIEFGLSTLIEISAELLKRKIAPNVPIQELLNDSVLQLWVKNGMPLHTERSKCAFCNNTLPQELWDRLNNHFSEESNKLENDIENLIIKLDALKSNVLNIKTPSKSSFYKSLHEAYDTCLKGFDTERSEINKLIEKLIGLLSQRKNSPFELVNIPTLQDNSAEFVASYKAIGSIIDKHNMKTSVLAEEQSIARTTLRLNEVLQHLKAIDYNNLLKKHSKLEEESARLAEDAKNAHAIVRQEQEALAQLKLQLKDERKGAERVNSILSHSFGHNRIQLKAVEQGDGVTFKFQIYRGKDIAYNLSEGECSLVSFCYFIAKLEDVNSTGKKLIIFIDDPISSLDSNHIFFMYSLIEHCIAKPLEDGNGAPLAGPDGKPQYSYKQLFISTHNLEFFKYLKRLPHPKKANEYFHVTLNNGTSNITLIPHYLKEYATELNYLFHEICVCALPGNARTQSHSFYGFGNTLRKFLEAYLFFKFPLTPGSVDNDIKLRMKRFFGDDFSARELIQRISNEYSHLAGRIDRSAEPIDTNEIVSTARYVLDSMQKSDSVQYSCFLESVELTDPLTITV